MPNELAKRYLGVTDSCSNICVLDSWLGVVLLDFTQSAFLVISRCAMAVQTP